MNIFELTQKEMIKEMIESGMTAGSSDKGYFESFKSLTATQIYNLVTQCAKFNKLDLDYSNEPLYYLMRDTRIVLVSATAGAGKTTLTCNKVDREIRFKGIKPESICMLSFNNDSVKDIKRKMLQTVNNNNLVTRRFGITMDEASLPNIRSLNSLTYNLVDQFKDYWHLSKIDIISNEDAIITMSQTLNSIARDTKAFEVTEGMVNNCLSVYDLVNETQKTVYELKNLSIVLDTNLKPDILATVLNSYRDRLHIQNKFHHSDTIRLVLELAESNINFRQLIENLYDVIVVDELQDISESIFRLIKIMVNTKNKLIAIGDGDQSIYGFRGSRPNTCFKFKEDFPEAELCTLSVNRRCSQKILEYAKEVISCVKTRNPQDLLAIRPNGEVNIHYYSNSDNVIDQISKYLVNIPKDKLGKLCIGFRKNVTCYYVAQKLMEYGIPFRVKAEMMPGSDKLSQHLKSIFAMLKAPSNLDLASKNLYKLLPIRKMSESERKVFLEKAEEYFEENDLEYFYEIPMSLFKLRGNSLNSAAEQMSTLERASNLVRKRGTMKEVMDLIFPLFKANFWNFTSMVTSFQPELEKMVIEIYSQDETYVEFQHRKKQMEDNVKRYIDKGYGIKLSSFHSLKGLEFDEVFLIELDGNNIPLIRYSDDATDQEIADLIDEELRLLYVAVTRARNKLHLYWSETDKSPFIDINKNFTAIAAIDTPILDLDLDLDLDTDTNTGIDEANTIEFDNSTAAVPDLDLSFDEPSPSQPSSQIIIKPSTQPIEITPKFDFSQLESSISNYSDADDTEDLFHLRDDFVDVKNGNELVNVLSFICNVIDAGGD